MADIWLIRHGQAGEVMGDYDKLSERGKAQARLAGERWRHLAPPALVVSGAMRRHRETAACFGETWGDLPVPTIDPAWNEFDHQVVVRAALAAGMQPDTTQGRAGFFRFFLDAMGRWSDGAHDVDYPESYAAFCARVNGGLDRVAAGLEPGQSALVFTSGGAISAVCRHLLELSPRRAFRINLALVNTGFTRLRVGAGVTSLATLNAHPHFDHAPELLTHS
jgi:broad specificity phosphatase PhoE